MSQEDFEDGLMMPGEGEEVGVGEEGEDEDENEDDNDESNESKIWSGGENDDGIYLAKAKENKPNDGLDEDVI